MDEILFAERMREPAGELLQAFLGDALNYWNEIVGFVECNYGPVTTEWKYYGKRSGWIQKLLLKKRNLLFFTPYMNYFSISMIFGDKAVCEIEKSNLPRHIVSDLVNARKYAEGRGIRIYVRDRENLNVIKDLLKIKISS